MCGFEKGLDVKNSSGMLILWSRLPHCQQSLETKLEKDYIELHFTSLHFLLQSGVLFTYLDQEKQIQEDTNKLNFTSL